MAGYLLTGFDLNRFETQPSMTIDDDGDPWVITSGDGTGEFPRTTYCARDLSSVVGTGEYTALAAAMTTAINGAVNGSNLYEVTWAQSTGYTIARVDGSAAFDLSFAGAAGTVFWEILGFTSNRSGAASYSSQVVPYYQLNLARDGASEFSRVFHTPGQTKRVMSVNASGYSVRPRTREQQLRMKLRFMPIERVFADDAEAAAPWTYEHLLDHAGCAEPVLFSWSGGDIVYKYTDPEFSESARVPVWRDFHGKWDLNVQGQYLGAL